ncbi:MAG: hypothetical protein AB1762_19290 [Gemmatimonadota bacterium]
MPPVDPAFDALRDQFVRAFSRAYVIPPEMRAAVRRAIRKHQTGPLSEETLTRFVNEPQSLLTTVRTLADEPHSLGNWGGLVDEWITAWEYNTTKQAPHVVLTIVNPDSRSQADLLHIVRSRNGRHFKCIPGPDCKSGNPRYLIESFAKCARRGITMVDVTGVLLHPEKLTPTQRKNFEAVCAQFPGRRPVPSSFTPPQRLRVKEDILHYLRTGKLPSELPEAERPPTPTLGRDFAPLVATLKQKAAEMLAAAPVVDWHQFTKVEVPTRLGATRVVEVSEQPAAEPHHTAAPPTIAAPVAIPPVSRVPTVPLPPPTARIPAWAKRLAWTLGEAVLWAGAEHVTQRILARFGLSLGPRTGGNARIAPPIPSENPIGEVARSSPHPHNVGGHLQRYLTRNGPEWRTKLPYLRGRK